jgi:hypothetical protein
VAARKRASGLERRKVRSSAGDLEETLHRRLEAGARLRTDLENFLRFPSDHAPGYLLEVLDQLSRGPFEGEDAAFLSRRLAVLAWDAVRCEPMSPRFGTGEGRLRFIVKVARDLRLMHFVVSKPIGVFRKRAADVDPKLDPWGNTDAKIERSVKEIAEVVGLQKFLPVNVGGEDRRRRRKEAPLTRALKVYAILAKGSEVATTPDTNTGRQSAAREIVKRAQAAPASVVP